MAGPPSTGRGRFSVADGGSRNGGSQGQGPIVYGKEEPPAVALQGTVDELWQQGNVLFRQRDYAGAAAHYTAVLERGGENAPPASAVKTCTLNRAACHLQLGKFNEVVTDCTAVLQREPTNVKALFRRAKALCNLRTDILSVSNAKQDLVVAAMIAPEDRQIRKLKEQVEHDLPLLEQRLLDLQFEDTPFWQVGDRVMVTEKGLRKLGGRGALQAGEVGVVLDVDLDMQAGGRVKVQGPRNSYWYDMEELMGAYEGQEAVDGVGGGVPVPVSQPDLRGVKAIKFVDPAGREHYTFQDTRVQGVCAASTEACPAGPNCTLACVICRGSGVTGGKQQDLPDAALVTAARTSEQSVSNSMPECSENRAEAADLDDTQTGHLTRLDALATQLQEQREQSQTGPVMTPTSRAERDIDQLLEEMALGLADDGPGDDEVGEG